VNVHGKGGKKMDFDNILTLLIIAGLGFMIFRGGGCCGSHGGHKGQHGDGADDANSDVERKIDR
jgi:hypothetical protein